MDTNIVVALISLAGLVIASVIGAFVSVHINRTEKRNTADSTLERTMEERILLRDERIIDLRDDVRERDERIEELEIQLVEKDELAEIKDFTILELQQELAELRRQQKKEEA